LPRCWLITGLTWKPGTRLVKIGRRRRKRRIKSKRAHPLSPHATPPPPPSPPSQLTLTISVYCSIVKFTFYQIHPLSMPIHPAIFQAPSILLVRWFVGWLVRSFVRWFVGSFVGSLVRSFVRLFVRSFLSLIHFFFLSLFCPRTSFSLRSADSQH
jgi:hypothetical protein